MIDLEDRLFSTEEKNAVNKFITAILNEYRYCRSIIRENFNKNLVVSVYDERSFKSSNKCWICDELFAEEDNKVRDCDHVTGKYRGSVHWDYNINLKFTKKVLVIFCDLRGYDNHLIMQ